MKPIRRRRMMCAAVAALAIFSIAGAATTRAEEPKLFDCLQPDDRSVFYGMSQLQPSDIWDPHDPNYGYDIRHLNRRLNLLAPRQYTEQWIWADIERLKYPDGHIVNYETPEDFLLAITDIKRLRPDHTCAIDGGLSVSWAQLLGRDGNTGEYRNHDSWREHCQQWRPAIEVADYWASSQYRDGHANEDLIERMRVFTVLFREQFPGKPLMIIIWHRERVGEHPNRTEEWVSARDFVEFGLACRNMRNHVATFGRENDPAEYRRAKRYVDELQARW